MTFVKICGITRVEDARDAAKAGADAIGFVFAPSPRRISFSKAQHIVRKVHPSIGKVGVFVDRPVAHIRSAIDQTGINGVQLQGSETPEMLRELRRKEPSLAIFKVIRFVSGDSPPERGALEKAFEDFVGPGTADALMLDTKDVMDLDLVNEPISPESLAGVAAENLIIAGGLSPDNVGRMVAEVRPWGVDVSSSLESAPGHKDPSKVRAFLRAVREADRANSAHSPEEI